MNREEPIQDEPARNANGHGPQSVSRSTSQRTGAKRPAAATRANGAARRLKPPTPHPPASTDTEPDPAGYTALFTVLDRAMHASVARYTLGLSPRAMLSAYFDWLGGLSFSPGKQAQLVHKAQRKWIRFLSYAQECAMRQGETHEACIEALPQDHRFRDEAWSRPPFNFVYQSFLFTQQWWHNATTGVSGMTAQNERAVEFAARQWLDIFSPSNFLLTNPVVLQRTMDQGGKNLVDGFTHYMEDVQALIAGRGAQAEESAFQVGRDVAITPGKVVYRNRLIELIQYAPATNTVRREPVLITPAWIMKYYILDLSPENSLVKFLVERGHTVFMISWKNPQESDRDLSMEDYRLLGPMAALDAIEQIIPDTPVHGVGYCIGGTLLAIAAATMARDGDERFKSLTFLAAQIDFEEAGELMLFINEKQIAFLNDLMWEQGFLDSTQMAGAFQLLRSNDLVWSRIVREYLMGERPHQSDLMSWNADGTRMPYRMHSEYLTKLFLHNDLVEGRYSVDGHAISVGDINAPLFVVGTESDHVAPWRSVYKFHKFTGVDLTFLLTNGGHNAGIVSDPRHAWRRYRVATRERGTRHLDPERWAERASTYEGSWWPRWAEWLDAHSSQTRVAPPELGGEALAPLADAPGEYVLQK